MTAEDPTDFRPTAPEGSGARAAARAGAANPWGAAAPTEPLHVPTRTLVLVGTALWALALVMTLAVPSLHTGQRSWWPWTCVTGIALGGFALWYVARQGRGDAAGL